MLTRLRVKGFKNLVDVDVRFDQFTCIAGPNGAGKSNLFDAITFLGDLASMPIMKAASRARGTNGRISDFQSLFFKNAKGEFLPMLFVAEMIVPGKVTPAAWIQKHISGPGQRTTPFIRTVPSDTEDPSSLPAIKLHGDQKGKKQAHLLMCQLGNLLKPYFLVLTHPRIPRHWLRAARCAPGNCYSLSRQPLGALTTLVTTRTSHQRENTCPAH